MDQRSESTTSTQKGVCPLTRKRSEIYHWSIHEIENFRIEVKQKEQSQIYHKRVECC